MVKGQSRPRTPSGRRRKSKWYVNPRVMGSSPMGPTASNVWSRRYGVAMKMCGTCQEIKPLTDFNRKASRPDGHQEVCRDCNRASSRRYYQRNREHHISVIRARTNAQRTAGIALITDHLLTHPCVDCCTSDLRLLDFDHRPGTNKRDAVMKLVRDGFSLRTIVEEVSKCDVRCRNCHAIVTYERMGKNWRSTAMRDQAGDWP